MKLLQLALLAFATTVHAHPGHPEPEHELIAKRHFNKHVRRGLAGCAEHLEKRGINEKARARREATVERYRRSLSTRDTDTIANTTHLSNASYTPATPETIIFEQTNTCILNPEGEVGPYWVKGEHIRKNLRETQPGVPIVIEGQFLDVETCEPLTDVYWDIWNCNATGVYGGVVETGNGNTADLANINATFLRGIQKTDSEGVATFESIFPGHYSGRTTHHHMIVYMNSTVNSNGTLTAGTYSHIGQVFWDQDLISKVEATYPYNTNNITITENAVDHVFMAETEDTTSDPVFNYVYLGEDLSDGLFGWITIAVNTSATYDPNYSFVLTEDGGVEESGGSSATVSGAGNGTANGTDGAMPSGSPPAALRA